MSKFHETGTTANWAPTIIDALTYNGMAGVINTLAVNIHTLNKTWWYDPATGYPINRNTGELLMLIVSELSEAMEGHRKNLPDDKLPHRSAFEVELADTFIRLMDLAGARCMDLGGAILEKLRYNMEREDHRPENRLKEGGKRY